MPQNHVTVISIGGQVMDSFTVRVLDSACSHGRAMLTITALIDANADAIYQALQEGDGASFTIRIPDGRRMMFDYVHGQTYPLRLYHVDLTRSERAAQMQARFDASS